LQVRSVELAMVHKVRTFVRSSFEDPDAPGMGDLDNRPEPLSATRTKSWNSQS
jgi:aspartate kinase